jgi:hypothetical protein
MLLSIAAPPPLPAELSASLPASIAAARASLRWPMTPDPPPLFYLPLSPLPRAREANAVPLLTAEAKALADDLDAVVDSLGGNDFARVAVALLLLGGGGADECHALVTPLSWPDGTSFGGPPVEGSAAAAEATWAHALVHRQEAFHVGEFGTGWHNSAFWYGMASISTEHTERMRALAVERASGDAEREAWVRANLPTPSTWAPKALNGLLNDALMDMRIAGAHESIEEGKGKLTRSLHQFAQELALIELAALLDDCLAKARR